MSDVQVPIDKEYDNPKRRPGANGFGDMLSRGGCSTNAGATPYSLMADFIDDAFEDCTLDNNEVEGMKVLAGLAPGAKPACPPTVAQPAPAPAPPAEPPRCETPAPPPACAPAPPPCPPEPMSPKDFMKAVGEKAVTSKGCSDAESKMIDLSLRLMHANLNQQQSFLGKLDEYIESGCEIDDEESCRLEAFVNDMLKPPRKDNAQPTSGDSEQPERSHRRTTTERVETRIDSWVERGGISPEVAEAAKRIQRNGG
jgi:hypothetical protein